MFKLEAEQLTLTAASIETASSANRVAGFSEGLNTGLALTGGGGSLDLATLGLLSGPAPLPNS